MSPSLFNELEFDYQEAQFSNRRMPFFDSIFGWIVGHLALWVDMTNLLENPLNAKYCHTYR
jgi:hypothetical protein